MDRSSVTRKKKIKEGGGGLDLRPFPFPQTQNGATGLGCLTDLMVLEGCNFLSATRKGEDIGVPLQNRATSIKPIQANFPLWGCVWPCLISAAALQKAACLGGS